MSDPSRRGTAIGVFVCSLALLLLSAPNIDHFLEARDPNWQLLLGRLVLHDQFPFVGFFQYYGPMVSFTSAAGLWVGQGVLPEALICAFAYSGALTLLFLLGSRCPGDGKAVGTVTGLVIAATGILMLSRFHKWYYWLFPLLVIYLFARLLESTKPRCVSLVICGFVAGLSWLYRMEIGVAASITVAVCLFTLARGSLGLRRFVVFFAAYLSGLFAIVGVWLVVLANVGGLQAISDYIAATTVGGAGIVKNWAIPIPALDWSKPFSLHSSLALADYLMILTYTIAVPRAVWQAWFGPERHNPRQIFTLFVSLMGLLLLFQGIYRADVSHFLQVMPLFVLTGCLHSCQIWSGLSTGETSAFHKAAKAGLVLYAVLVVTSFFGLRERCRVDLGPIGTNLVKRYHGLVTGSRAEPDHVVSRLSTLVRRHTTAEDSILVPLEYEPQILMWADRPMSGILPVYAQGLLDNETWRMRNLDAVKADPPTLVIVRASFLDPKAQPAPVQQRHSELYDYVFSTYQRELYRLAGKYVILSR